MNFEINTQVVVSDNTHRLISGLFVVDEHGASALKDIKRSRHLYRIIQPKAVRGGWKRRLRPGPPRIRQLGGRRSYGSSAWIGD